MHPELGQSAFSKWYTSDPLIDIAKQLLDCREDDLQMGEYQVALRAHKYWHWWC
jgi:hypothetical protein